MPTTECDTCGGQYNWSWTEAFDKFGFNDGDGQIETWQVESVLTEAGYAVEVEEWGLHNILISSIKLNGEEIMFPKNKDIEFGYDDPRDYLPAELIQLLDEKCPD